MRSFYHKKQRELQDAFDTRRLADRVHEVIVHDTISDEDKEFIETRDMFFLSTVDADGYPTVSYKGGAPGFVRVLDEKTLAFPSYDGNGMFMSMGNMLANNRIGMLFIDFENPHRVRLHGAATVSRDDELLSEYHEAQLIVRITVENMFINCPRYIHRMKKIEQSEYVPEPGCEAPVPEWKTLVVVQDVLPESDKKKIG
ncbi:MAG: pyridoxamine 5'-phosphate oxidase family protein [Gammaproteobacteria bacterium]